MILMNELHFVYEDMAITSNMDMSMQDIYQEKNAEKHRKSICSMKA